MTRFAGGDPLYTHRHEKEESAMSDHVKESVKYIMDGLLEQADLKANPKGISVQVTLAYPDERVVMKKTVKGKGIDELRQLKMVELPDRRGEGPDTHAPAHPVPESDNGQVYESNSLVIGT
jgi:hypothetical protein